MSSGWVTTTLGAVCQLQSGAGFPTKYQGQSEGQYPFFKVSDMNLEGNEIAFSRANNYVSDEVRDSLRARIFPAGSVLFPKVGGAIATNKKRKVVQPSCVDNNIMGLIPKPELIDPEFLFQWMNGLDIYDFSNKANPPSITQGTVSSWPIDLPPLDEQRRIIAKLDRAFAALELARVKAEENWLDSKELGTRCVAEILFGSIAEHWAELSISELATVDWGNTSLTKASYVEEGGFLAVSAAGCDGRIGHAEHQAHTPVLSAIGARCGRMFMPDEDFTAIKNTITLSPRQDRCDSYFLFYLMSAVDLPKRGAGQPFISKGDIQKFAVRVPSLDEQCRLAKTLKCLHRELDCLERRFALKLKDIAALRQSLLQAAFSGQLS
ncbi:MAG TPA: restriction endonuclease subunit S [Candidatus Competibacter sp.]|nr:restriction endonuclease subunit S [Candidatus Competibacter sp.]